jgi:hypothetical protein
MILKWSVCQKAHHQQLREKDEIKEEEQIHVDLPKANPGGADPATME